MSVAVAGRRRLASPIVGLQSFVCAFVILSPKTRFATELELRHNPKRSRFHAIRPAKPAGD